jgi:hypothetical protein
MEPKLCLRQVTAIATDPDHASECHVVRLDVVLQHAVKPLFGFLQVLRDDASMQKTVVNDAIPLEPSPSHAIVPMLSTLNFSQFCTNANDCPIRRWRGSQACPLEPMHPPLCVTALPGICARADHQIVRGYVWLPVRPFDHIENILGVSNVARFGIRMEYCMAIIIWTRRSFT